MSNSKTPLWRLMDAAYNDGAYHEDQEESLLVRLGPWMGRAAEIRALAEAIDERFSNESHFAAVSDVVKWLQSEADRAEAGE